MWTDRLVTIFLAAIAALLTAYFVHPSTSNAATKVASGLVTGTNTIYDVKLVQDIPAPGVKSVIPLAWTSTGDTNAATFAIQTIDHVYVFHVNHFTTSN
jgi:hypothetical protein